MVLLPEVGACVDRYEADERGVPAQGKLPARRVSFHEADRACHALGSRLCHGREWTRACAGVEGTRAYPYGGQYERDRCNTHDSDEDAQAERPEPGGARERCASPEGVMDLSGNVWEWTDEADVTGTLRELRGGGFGVGGEDVACALEDRSFQPLDASFDGYGFRCCADVRPR
jgi:formylglycine-generating enzyme required for sulfatase activity